MPPKISQAPAPFTTADAGIESTTVRSRQNWPVIHGVDFSGATDAGRRIWVSSGAVDGGRLRISQTRPAYELPHGGAGREEALGALVDFVRGESNAAIGLDFPFGLPRPVVAEASWREFVLTFNKRYGSAEAFRAGCRSRSQRELRRATDRQARAPWSAWNWRLYRQTYYGIGWVLSPLVEEEHVRVLPMENADDSRAWLLEICPASTLRRLGVAGLPYKGGADRVHRASRKQILDRLMANRPLLADPRPIARAIDDAGGDAVDSIVAAAAVYDALVNGRLVPEGTDHLIEGFVYF